MITIYGYPNTRATRITWMMEELGQEYTYSLVDFTKNGAQAPDFLAINPAGKIPAVRDDDLLLTESAAIITHLGDKFENRVLVPAAGTIERAKYNQWCYFTLSELEQPLWTMGKHRFAIPKQYRVKEIFPTAAWEFQKALDLLSRGLADQHYILGQQFSAADILLTQTLLWGLSFEQPIKQQNLLDYYQRNKQRPALARAKEREKSAVDTVNG